MKHLFWALMVFAAALLLSSAALSQRPSLPADNGVLDPITAKTDLYPADADAKKEIEVALKELGYAREKR